MGNHKWIIFLIALYIIAMFLGCTFEESTGTSWAGASEQNTLEYLMNFKNITYSQTDTGTWSFVGINTQYFNTIWGVLTFDFAFFDDDLYPGSEMFRWIFFVPFAIGIAFGLAILFIDLLQGFIPFT
jgi:hypothetical protein